MGYYITQMENSFRINEKNVCGAWQALRSLFWKDMGTIHDGSGFHYSWINSSSVLDANTFKDAMSAARWSIELDQDGNVNEIYFDGEKYGDDDLILFAIAPYVEDGSYIIVQGEDGERWKWLFRGGGLKEISGRFVFDDE